MMVYVGLVVAFRGKPSPSPTRNWYSGPVGVESMLLVSMIGDWPAATAALYAAECGYRGGGGGNTLRSTSR